MVDHAALIARLEALTGPDREVDIDLMLAFLPKHREISVIGIDRLVRFPQKYDRGWKDVDIVPYTASLDAVIALVERELPGMAWALGQNVHHRYWRASLNRLNDEGAPESIAWGQSNQPVIALLLALLRSKPNGGDNG